MRHSRDRRLYLAAVSFLALFATGSVNAQGSADVLIRGGTIYDGSDATPYKGVSR
jgi:hypothetical protein